MSVTLNDCGLLCLGGSERRGCHCASPIECQLRDHPKFPWRRLQAMDRFKRLLGNALASLLAGRAE